MAVCSIPCTNSRLATVRKKNGERRDARRNNSSVCDPASHLGIYGTNMAGKSICCTFQFFACAGNFRETSVNCEPLCVCWFFEMLDLYLSIICPYLSLSSVFCCFEHLSCYLVGGRSVPVPFHPQTSHQNATDIPRHFPGKPIDVMRNGHPFALRRSGGGN